MERGPQQQFKCANPEMVMAVLMRHVQLQREAGPGNDG